MDEYGMATCAAFEGSRCVASGSLVEVARKAKNAVDQGGSVLIFNGATGEVVEVDFRGTVDDVVARLDQTPPARGAEEESTKAGAAAQVGPGRPKLGVVAREVTLLPRHWEWLSRQPGGASVALRKLVEEARRVNSGKDKVRYSQEAAYRFMSAMAGNLPGFEEATRALFAGARDRFDGLLAPWPVDVRDFAQNLARGAFQTPPPGTAA